LPNLEQQRSRAITSDADSDRYRCLAKALVGHALPAAVLDLDLLEDNARALLRRADRLHIRIGTKSVRCTDVLRRVQSLSPRYAGLLCYSAQEAAWLASKGFEDLVVAYPTADVADLDCVARQRALGKRIVLMVDDAVQLQPLIARARAFGIVFLVAIDLDCSTVFPRLYFGVRRSGYVASGPAGRDRLPRPFLPAGLKLLSQEGAGEVQTPVNLPAGIRLSIGDPVFFRHAKAGELAERFTHFLLMRAGIVEQRVPTYRGEGRGFP
jgi:D-serine deaminase-like pyridoxal phosphate-dependent protein